MSEKLLVELEDFTMLRGRETRQEVYFVFLGYDPEGKGAKDGGLADKSNPELARFIPEDQVLSKFFYMGSSPLFRVRRGQKHVFPGGYPIYYDAPQDIVSFYMAVVESDKGARQVFKELFKEKGAAKSLLDTVIGMLQKSNPSLKAVQAAHSLLIKAVELIILKDDIRYTNVLTFKTHDGYLEGTHSDWGNQRVAFTIESVPPRPA